MGVVDLAGLLRAAAERLPDKPALVFRREGGDDPISYAAFDEEADRVARALQDAGVSKGDRVAIAMPNRPEFAYSYFGILRAGAVAVPLNVMSTAVEIEKILRDASAAGILLGGPFGAVAREAAGPAGVAVLAAAEGWREDLGSGTSPAPVDVSEDDLAVLSYTSGTTGEPKGAMLTHGNLLANLKQQMEVPDGAREDDVMFLALPLFHIFGLNVTLGLLVMNGATGLILERFEPVDALRAIQEHRVTVLFGAPTMYVAWVNTPGADQYDLSSVRMAISGAAPLAAEVLATFSAEFGIDIFEGYGLTETSPTLTSCRIGGVPRPGSVGKPLPGIELRLVDDVGADVELGDPGEVIVKGPNVFAGYWNKPEETEKAFTGGWFRTGDIGIVDEEGYLYLVDRKRDLIIVSGFNVFPSEVEEALLRVPGVAEAAVVGVPHRYTGEAVKGYVVLDEGSDLDADRIQDAVRGDLARFKCPESIDVVESLPQLVTGKVLRRALR